MKKLHNLIVAALLVTFSTSSVTLALNNDNPKEKQSMEMTANVEQTVYHFVPNTDDDWTNPLLWEPGSANACGGLNIPCQVDLIAAGYSSIEEMLADFEEEDLQDFLDHPGVDAKF